VDHRPLDQMAQDPLYNTRAVARGTGIHRVAGDAIEIIPGVERAILANDEW
jgi:hypothetical protein